MKDSPYVATTNACKLCTPMGAALAFKGIEGCIPFLHGSQGCATYMRRYIISHFREPMDIASSALGEKQAVFGGGPNLKKGLLNVMQKYHCSVVGVASTCLTETIGDDVAQILFEFRKEFGDLPLADVIHVSTPSYNGTHMDGFHHAVKATVDQMVNEVIPNHGGVNCLPGFASPADIRYLKEIFADFDVPATVLPDISQTLDGPILDDYAILPDGGTPMAEIKKMSGASATFEFGRMLEGVHSAASVLEEKFNVPAKKMGLPIGLRESDEFFTTLAEVTETEIPQKHRLERERLLDAFVDGHKYIYGKRAVVYGEEDLVIGLVSFLSEIGIQTVLAATGSSGKNFKKAIAEVATKNGATLSEPPKVIEGVDFHDIAETAKDMAPDLLIGHSKGYRYAKEWGVPLVRVGFPIHDRFGGQRVVHLGYRGAQSLFDTLVNTVLEKKQADSPVGYGYL